MRPQTPAELMTQCSTVPGSCGSGKPSVRVEQASIAQGPEHRGEMSGSRAVEPFEPILIEKRGERRLAKRCLPKDPEKRCRRLVLLPFERRQNRRALGRVAIER